MDENNEKPSRADLLARCNAALDAMAPEARHAVIEVMNWMTLERPKDVETPSDSMFQTWVDEVM